MGSKLEWCESNILSMLAGAKYKEVGADGKVDLKIDRNRWVYDIGGKEITNEDFKQAFLKAVEKLASGSKVDADLKDGMLILKMDEETARKVGEKAEAMRDALEKATDPNYQPQSEEIGTPSSPNIKAHGNSVER